MMSWILGLAWRVLLFWGLWISLTIGLLAMLDGQELSGEALGLLGRTSLFLSVAVLAFAEWARLNRAILAMGTSLERARRAQPRRWEMATHGCLVIVLAAGFWGLALLLFSSAIHRADEGQVLGLLSVGTLAWTVVSLLVLTVLVGGLTRLRYRVAARGLVLPPLPVTLPWVVGGWSALGLLLAFFGLPDPRLVAALLNLAVVASAEPSARGDVELLVELGPDDHIQEIAGLLQDGEATCAPAFPDRSPIDDPVLASTWVVTAPVEQVLGLALLLDLDDENVSAIELNAAVSADPLAQQGACDAGTTLLPVNDPLAGGQSELVQMRAGGVLTALQRARPSQPVLVAVIDTGVAGTLDELSGVMAPWPVYDDRDGHGTAVASLAGAAADNGRGIASFNLGGRFLRVRSLPALAEPRAAADDVARAVLDAIDAGAGVINLSFGAKGEAPRSVREAVARATRRGGLVVASAGNGGGQARDQWPANLPGVIVVGAASSSGGRAASSNRTDGLAGAVSAPGEAVCALTAGGDYRRISGTSVAAPLVSGLVGVMKALCPGLGPTEAVELLQRTGAPMTGTGLGPLVQADRAVAELLRVRTDCYAGGLQY